MSAQCGKSVKANGQATCCLHLVVSPAPRRPPTPSMLALLARGRSSRGAVMDRSQSAECRRNPPFRPIAGPEPPCYLPRLLGWPGLYGMPWRSFLRGVSASRPIQKRMKCRN